MIVLDFVIAILSLIGAYITIDIMILVSSVVVRSKVLDTGMKNALLPLGILGIFSIYILLCYVAYDSLSAVYVFIEPFFEHPSVLNILRSN